MGSLIIKWRTVRVRKFVVDSGPGELGRWREHRRDLRADFRLAVGEDPGPLVSVAQMFNGDNTHSRAHAWYGRVVVQGAEGLATVAPALKSGARQGGRAPTLP